MRIYYYFLCIFLLLFSIISRYTQSWTNIDKSKHRKKKKKTIIAQTHTRGYICLLYDDDVCLFVFNGLDILNGFIFTDEWSLMMSYIEAAQLLVLTTFWIWLIASTSFYAFLCSSPNTVPNPKHYPIYWVIILLLKNHVNEDARSVFTHILVRSAGDKYIYLFMNLVGA